MGEQGHQKLQAEDTAQGPSPDRSSPGTIRNLILWTIAVLLLAAWQAYDGFKRPESRSNHLLQAVAILLVGILGWARRLRQGDTVFKPRWGIHWTAAFAPLLVLAAFGWAQYDEARNQAARNELVQKKQAWQEAVQRQRELSDLASEQVNAALRKQAEALRALIDNSQKLKLTDGKPGIRPDPDATRKLDEAKEEYNRAFERNKAERERLLAVERERPN